MINEQLQFMSIPLYGNLVTVGSLSLLYDSSGTDISLFVLFRRGLVVKYCRNTI